MTSKEELKKLSKGEKKVVARVLSGKEEKEDGDSGITYREIGRILSCDGATAWRWAQEPVPTGLQQFATKIHEVFKQQKFVLTAKCIARLKELVPKERKISEVVKAAEFAEGRDMAPAVAIQQNIQSGKILIFDGGEENFDELCGN